MAGKTVRIIHFADLHLGVETYGRLDPDTGFNTRMLDILSSLDFLVEFAIKNMVDLVLFCGDAYKDRSPNPTLQRELARRIKKLSESGINTLMLTGNHDLPNAVNRATATEIFDTLSVDKVNIVSRPGIYVVQSPTANIQVIAIPWLRRINLMDRTEIKNLDINTINQKMEEFLTTVIANNVQKLDPGMASLLAAHLWVKGASTGTEKGSTIGREPEILLSNIALSGLDYIALGHIHRRQVLSENPPVVYPGSLVKLDFSDADDQKGFYVVEITLDENNKRSVFYKFQPVQGRSFVTIPIEIDAADLNPTQTILRMIDKCLDQITGSITRLEISIPESMEALLNDREIKAALKPAHFFTISRNISRPPRNRLAAGGNFSAESITPIEALKAWIDQAELEKIQKERLLEYGASLIEEIRSGD